MTLMNASKAHKLSTESSNKKTDVPTKDEIEMLRRTVLESLTHNQKFMRRLSNVLLESAENDINHAVARNKTEVDTCVCLEKIKRFEWSKEAVILNEFISPILSKYYRYDTKKFWHFSKIPFIHAWADAEFLTSLDKKMFDYCLKRLREKGYSMSNIESNGCFKISW